MRLSRGFTACPGVTSFRFLPAPGDSGYARMMGKHGRPDALQMEVAKARFFNHLFGGVEGTGNAEGSEW
jgi:hypothetical protein